MATTPAMATLGTPAEIQAGTAPTGEGGPGQPVENMTYPSGMSVHPGTDEMGKMGVEMPKVGDKMHVEGHGHVTATHEHGFSVQMTHAAMKPHSEGKSSAEKMYGGKKG